MLLMRADSTRELPSEPRAGLLIFALIPLLLDD
jgi:hypothetical protein